MAANTGIPLPGAVPNPVPGFVLEELDDDLLLFNPDDGRMLELNNTAALIWQLCDGRRSVGEITELLTSAFPESAGDINNDVPKILGHLAQMSAITWQ